jgi:HlyD family secretion protein
VALAQAEANVAIKRAALERTIADLDHQERALASELAAQIGQRDRAKWEFERIDTLREAGHYTEPATRDKRMALDIAERQVDRIRHNLARAQVRTSSGVRVDEASARAELVGAKAGLAKAQADLDLAYIRAPGAGRVLKLNARVGERIGSNGFCEIGDTHALVVRAEVFESDALAVKTGAVAEATSRALPRALSGRIAKIGWRVGKQNLLTTDPAVSADARVVEVTIELDRSSTELVAGLTNLQVRVAIER